MEYSNTKTKIVTNLTVLSRFLKENEGKQYEIFNNIKYVESNRYESKTVFSKYEPFGVYYIYVTMPSQPYCCIHIAQNRLNTTKIYYFSFSSFNQFEKEVQYQLI